MYGCFIQLLCNPMRGFAQHPHDGKGTAPYLKVTLYSKR